MIIGITVIDIDDNQTFVTMYLTIRTVTGNKFVSSC